MRSLFLYSINQGTVLRTKTLHPTTGKHLDSRVSINLFGCCRSECNIRLPVKVSYGIRDSVDPYVSHVQLAGRVREHAQHVEVGLTALGLGNSKKISWPFKSL